MHIASWGAIPVHGIASQGKARMKALRGTLLLTLTGALLLGLGSLCGCQRQVAPPPQKIQRDPNRLIVYGVCALAQMIDSARQEFESENAGKSVDVTVLQPAEIVQRVENGDVPDIVVFVGEAELTQLEQGGFLDRGSRQSTGELVLVIAVPKGNPGGVHGPQDLAGVRLGGIATSLAGMTSLGTAAKRELERAGLWKDLQDKLTVTATAYETLQAVADGKAEAGILFDPCPRFLTGDAIASDAVEFVSPLTEAAAERLTRIHAEGHKRSPNALLAQRFLRQLMAQELPAAPVEEAKTSDEVGQATEPVSANGSDSSE